jgi:hypothetical protein
VVELKKAESENNFGFPFAEVDRDWDEFLQAMGQHQNYWMSQIRGRIHSLVDTNVMSWSLMPSMALLAGLTKLLDGARMSRSHDIAMAAAFVSLFMKVWRLASDEQRTAMLGRWKDGMKHTGHLMSFMFELAVGVLYTQSGNTVVYYDLAGDPSAFDWMVNPGTSIECHVEAKSTSWRTKIPLDGKTLKTCRAHIKAYEAKPVVAAFEGFIRLKFSGKTQVSSRKTAAAQLFALLEQATPPISDEVGEWHIEFLSKPENYNIEFRRFFEHGHNVSFEGCGMAIVGQDGVGPIFGILFRENWDHGLAVAENLETALQQVADAEMSAVWIQVSGMPSQLLTLKQDAITLFRSQKSLKRYFHLVQNRRNHGYCGLHIAIDFDFFYPEGQDVLSMLLPNVIMPPPTNEGIRKYSRYTAEIMKRSIEKDISNALISIHPGKGLSSQAQGSHS